MTLLIQEKEDNETIASYAFDVSNIYLEQIKNKLRIFSGITGKNILEITITDDDANEIGNRLDLLYAKNTTILPRGLELENVELKMI